MYSFAVIVNFLKQLETERTPIAKKYSFQYIKKENIILQR